MNKLVQNIRIWLWYNLNRLGKTERVEGIFHAWTEAIQAGSVRCGIAEDRLERLVRGTAEATHDEIAKMATSVDVDPFVLTDESLFDEWDIEVKEENVRYLMGLISDGQRADFCRKHDIHPQVAHRWAHKGAKLTRKNETKFKNAFGLNGIDLGVVTLFLSLEPIDGKSRKEEVIRLLEQMPIEKVDQYYPALRKLLE